MSDNSNKFFRYWLLGAVLIIVFFSTNLKEKLLAQFSPPSEQTPTQTETTQQQTQTQYPTQEVPTSFKPTAIPPGGNVSAPINTGPTEQTKTGNLNLQGNLKLDGTFNFKGVNFTAKSINEFEDSYFNYRCWSRAEAATAWFPKDDCDPADWYSFNNPYTCPVTVTKNCIDTYLDSGCGMSNTTWGPYPNFRSRNVSCVHRAAIVAE